MPPRKQTPAANWDTIKDLVNSKRAPAMVVLFNGGFEPALEHLLPLASTSFMPSVFVAAIKTTGWRPSSHEVVQQLFPQQNQRTKN